jgi:hypothetical protein
MAKFLEYRELKEKEYQESRDRRISLRYSYAFGTNRFSDPKGSQKVCLFSWMVINHRQ